MAMMWRKSVDSLQPVRRQGGFSLVELMVALTIGLLLLTGLTTILVNSGQARDASDRANRQLENGRFALSELLSDFRNAGYFAEFDPTVLSAPASLAAVDVCATAVTDLKSNMPLHVQGIDNKSSTPSCISDVRDGTDILVIRRVSTCVAGSAGCDGVTAGAPYFQASLCDSGSELGSADVNDYYNMDTDTAALTRTQRDCTTAAEKHRFITHIYFIADNDNAGDGIPTLKRAELGATGFSTVSIAQGVENLQVEYGLDTDSDGSPNVYTTDPNSYGGCAGAACVDNWQSAVAVKVHLLARNIETSLGYSDTKTYNLGIEDDGSDNSFGPYNDGYKRHAFQSMVRLYNPSARRS